MDAEKLSEVARYLGKLPKRRRFTRTCPICYTEFAATARGRFCSSKCRSRDQAIRARMKREPTSE